MTDQPADDRTDPETGHQLADGRVVDPWSVLDGARVAHRLTADDLRHGVLARSADLAVLDALFDDEEGELFLGEEVHLQDVHPELDRDLLALYEIPADAVPPEGATLLVGVDLTDAAVGDVIVIAIDGGSATLVGPMGAADAGVTDGFDELTGRAVASALVDGWRAAVQADVEEPDPELALDPSEPPVPVEDLVFEALILEPRIVGAGSPPFGATLAAGGWVTDGEVVGPAGTDLDLWARTLEIAELAGFYRLDEAQAVALGHLLEVFDAVKDQVEPTDEGDAAERPTEVPAVDGTVDLGEDADAALSWLHDPDVASAFVSQAIGIRTDHATALFQFATAARTVAPRSATAAVLWLEAKALNRLGLALAAAERLDEAVRLDREFVPLLLDAANLASDRGDASAAIRLARGAGLNEDDDFVRALTEMLPTAPAGIGRNDPCFCGSGRKYKQCHLGRQTLDLDERAGWLYRKALEWIQDTPWRLRLLEIATAYSPDDEDDEQVLHLAMSEPFIADLAFSDDGAWHDFVAERGVLLPADELALAERWASIGRSVFEVTAVHAGTGVEVRDLRAGADAAAVVVAERTFSNHATVGDAILARVLPTGTTDQFFGGIIALAALEQDGLIELLDADASGVEIAAHLGSLRGGPRLTNTEGEPLVFCGATYRVPDPTAARAALDADPELRADRTRPTDGDAEGIEPFDAAWLAEVTIDGHDWIRSRYTLRGDELVLEANSEVRITRAQERVAALVPDAELVHEEQRPLDELADTAPIDPRAMLAQPTPELQAVMDEFARSAELQWLDSPVPALDGSTPRDAADPDHPRHAALLDLLDDLARPVPADALAAIDIDRLRSELGLGPA